MSENRYDREGGCTFPFAAQGPGGETSEADAGMTLRDWFAGHALAGLVQLMPSRIGFDEQVASVSYRVADAMIAEREKGGAQ